MMLKTKIHAGALQYVLVVSVIIAIIIFAFISLIFLQQKVTVKHQFSKETMYNVQNGFEYLKKVKFPYDELVEINLSENPLEETTLLKKHWGVFDIAMISSQIKNEFYQKVALLGTENRKRDAIYIKDNNQSLVLVGNTKITGNVSIPKQGVKRGNIAGTSFYGNQLINGNIKTSNPILPKIKNVEYVKDFLKNYRETDFENLELAYNTTTFRSFTEKMLVYESPNPIILEDISLIGHILIVSNTEIRIKASANLEDIIVIAPKVFIEINAVGNFQVFATEIINVQNNSLLTYPSALVVLEEDLNSINSKEEHQIIISENAEVRGVLVFQSERKSTDYKPQVVIQETAKIIGEIYCSKNIEVRGSVFGSIYTNNFLVNEAGGIYINHIFNGIINAKKIPEEYAGLQINSESNAVVKWVR